MERILGLYAGKKSILGVCLGLQAIYLYFGGRLVQMDEVAHGRSMIIRKTGSDTEILREIQETFEAGLYHSWIADPGYLPSSLIVTARTTDGRIMGIRHSQFDIEAVQFHPESVMTPLGTTMIISWLEA